MRGKSERLEGLKCVGGVRRLGENAGGNGYLHKVREDYEIDISHLFMNSVVVI